MTLAQKIRYLREVEGSLRDLGRPMTQQELLKAIQSETGGSISQSYLSQIEGGKRPHMTQSTRTLLAKFSKVQPGFLVDDPEGYHTELTSDLRSTEGQLDVWQPSGSSTRKPGWTLKNFANRVRVDCVICGRFPPSICERYDWLREPPVSALIALSSSCCVIGRSSPRREPSTSRR